MTTALSIRAYTPDDFDAVRGLWNACGLTRPWNDPARDIDFCMETPTAALFVGEADDTLCATVMAGHDGHRGWLYYLGVAPDHQKNGHGEAMVRHAENWLRGLGVHKVLLMIRPENEAARDFYHAAGYEDEPRIVMARIIDKDSTS